MLGPEFGGLKPWDMRRLTPDEELRILQYRREVT